MSKFRRFMRRLRMAVILLLVLLIVAAAAWLTTGGVSNRTILETLLAESTLIQDKVDARADEIVQKLDAMDRKLEASDKKLKSIDEKLDRLLLLANPPLPDGLQRVD